MFELIVGAAKKGDVVTVKNNVNRLIFLVNGSGVRCGAQKSEEVKSAIIACSAQFPVLYECIGEDMGYVRSLIRLYDSIASMYESLSGVVEQAGGVELAVHYIQETPLETMSFLKTMARWYADAIFRRPEVQACIAAGLREVEEISALSAAAELLTALLKEASRSAVKSVSEQPDEWLKNCLETVVQLIAARTVFDEYLGDLVELLATYLLFKQNDVNPCPTVGPLIATLFELRASDYADSQTEGLARRILGLFVAISADPVLAPCLMGDQVISFCVRECDIPTADDVARVAAGGGKFSRSFRAQCSDILFNLSTREGGCAEILRQGLSGSYFIRAFACSAPLVADNFVKLYANCYEAGLWSPEPAELEQLKFCLLKYLESASELEGRRSTGGYITASRVAEDATDCLVGIYAAENASDDLELLLNEIRRFTSEIGQALQDKVSTYCTF